MRARLATKGWTQMNPCLQAKWGEVAPHRRNERSRSETTTTATTLAAGRVRGDGGDVLDAADAHTGTGEGTEGGLATGAGLLGAGTAGSTELDVEGSDADLLALGGDVLGGEHRGVGRRLVTVGLDLHAAGDTRDGLLARKVGDVNEGVVEPIQPLEQRSATRLLTLPLARHGTEKTRSENICTRILLLPPNFLAHLANYSS